MRPLGVKTTRVLVVNVGGASTKLAWFVHEGGRVHCERRFRLDRGEETIPWGAENPDVVLHRVVHAGPQSDSFVELGAETKKKLTEWSHVARLHQTEALAWMERVGSMYPAARSFACVDTSFFGNIPLEARRYAVPNDWEEKFGIVRLGFHGWAHRSMWQQYTQGDSDQLARKNPSRVVSLQLGSGCSAAALVDGKPVDCSMGFTPLEGLVMATRCGDLDPGVVLHLLRTKKISEDALEEALYEQAGLLGLSGLSGEMKTLLESPQVEAAQAVDSYCYRVRKYVGAFAAAMGGLDAILFGGGVGQQSPRVRSKVLQGLEWMGVVVDEGKNQATKTCGSIVGATGRVDICVMDVDEEGTMAKAAAQAGLLL